MQGGDVTASGRAGQATRRCDESRGGGRDLPGGSEPKAALWGPGSSPVVEDVLRYGDRPRRQMQTRRAVADPRWGRTSHVGHHMGEAPLTNRGVQPTCLFAPPGTQGSEGCWRRRGLAAAAQPKRERGTVAADGNGGVHMHRAARARDARTRRPYPGRGARLSAA